MLDFDAFIGCCEVPIGLGVVGIAVVLPSGDFVDLCAKTTVALARAAYHHASTKTSE
jgi:hypothetical protein